MNTLVKLAVIWFAASIGYYYVIPFFGLGLSYSLDPVTTSLYYLSLSGIVVLIFRKIFFEKFEFNSKLWQYPFLLTLFSIIILTFLYSFSTLSQISTNIDAQTFSSYIDILLANKWYFFPKAFEVLFQDLLITILILELYKKYGSLKQVQVIYFCLFGGMHVIQLAFTNTENLYSLLLVFSSLLSTLIFPRLIINTKGGFIYMFTVHFLFYLFLAMFLHLYPPFGYFKIT